MTLAGQPIGTLADLSAEFEEASREVLRSLDTDTGADVEDGEATPSPSDADMERPPPEESGDVQEQGNDQ